MPARERPCVGSTEWADRAVVGIVRLISAAALVALVAGCGIADRRADRSDVSAPAVAACANAGTYVVDCEVPGYADRPFGIAVPSAHHSAERVPLVVFLHGGGGNGSGAYEFTCPDHDVEDPACLHAVGEREGFITAYPNGTGLRVAPEIRTWNAGGGGPDFACVSGSACQDGVDDIAYLNAVLDQVQLQYAIDESRVYLVGFSNGAAMAHRFACAGSERIAAIAALSGANQFAADADCTPSRPVSVIQVHGTADECWTYEASSRACADHDPRPKIGVVESTQGWVERLECDPTPAASRLPDDVDDGTVTDVATYTGCSGGVQVQLLSVVGGGHVYPQGIKVRPRREDVTTQDWGNAVLWELLEAAGTTTG
jgi:polyhydroxybutyrate depolymerase